MTLRARRPDTPPWWRSPRWIGAILVVLIHAGAIGVILSSMPAGRALLSAPREVFFHFPVAQKTARLPVRIEPSAARHRALGTLLRYPPAAAAVLPPPAASVTRNGLDVALFGCRPENVANLAPAERAQCGDAFASYAYRAAMPGTVQTEALQAARWRSALAERNAPLAEPCTGTASTQGTALGHRGSAVMADPMCLFHLVTR
jgi:hypothetical protein